MSFKAYLFRMQTPEDVEDVHKLVSCTTVPSSLDLIYMPDRKVTSSNREIRGMSRQTFKPTDLVAALTVDRGDLAKTFYEEVGVTFEDREPFWLRLDQFAATSNARIENRDGDGFRVEGWKVLPWSEETWVRNAKACLSKEAA